MYHHTCITCSLIHSMTYSRVFADSEYSNRVIWTNIIIFTFNFLFPKGSVFSVIFFLDPITVDIQYFILWLSLGSCVTQRHRQDVVLLFLWLLTVYCHAPTESNISGYHIEWFVTLHNEVWTNLPHGLFQNLLKHQRPNLTVNWPIYTYSRPQIATK